MTPDERHANDVRHANELRDRLTDALARNGIGSADCYTMVSIGPMPREMHIRPRLLEHRMGGTRIWMLTGKQCQKLVDQINDALEEEP